MKISYYPGCTLKTKARNLGDAAVAAMAVFGIELEELPRWNCCGAVHSLTDDDLIHQVASVRDLIRAQEQGSTMLLTLCSMCYNTLARANMLMRNDEEKCDTINRFMDEEIDYFGEVEVVHLLTFMRDHIGWEKLRDAVKIPLEGLKVAPYYGCTLQRPRDVGIEPPGSFALMSRFLESLGATVVRMSASDVCCGSYQIVANPEAAGSAAANIVKSAARAGAEAMAMSCPLCEYNIGIRQETLHREGKISHEVPTFYFTQLLALALGLDPEISHLELNGQASIALLKSKQYDFAFDKIAA